MQKDHGEATNKIWRLYDKFARDKQRDEEIDARWKACMTKDNFYDEVDDVLYALPGWESLWKLIHHRVVSSKYTGKPIFTSSEWLVDPFEKSLY